MREYPFFRLFIADFMRDTRRMSQEQKGDYIDSLLDAWLSSEPASMPSWMAEQVDSIKSISAKRSIAAVSRWDKSNSPPIQEPPKEHKPKRETKPKDSSDFERFWTAYPKKIGKLDASKSWERAKGKPPIDQIIDILENQKASKQWQKDGGQYIPNPSTWLNQGRWEDSLEKERTWEDLERELSESFGTPVRLLENHDINNQQRN